MLRKVAQIFAKNGAYVTCVRVPDACARKNGKNALKYGKYVIFTYINHKY